jgi:hypothetical protein
MLKNCRNCGKKLKKETLHSAQFRFMSFYCSLRCAKEMDKKRRRKYYLAKKEGKIRKKTSMRHELLKTLGKTCIICGTTRKTVFHEIRGKNHPNLLMRDKTVFIERGFEFCPICYSCHIILSLLAKRNLNNEQFKKLMELLALIQK